jgi:virulence-associated protein VagC
MEVTWKCRQVGMPWMTEMRQSEVLEKDDDRLVVIPKDFVLVGDKTIIRQEKDGVITIHPATEEGRRALDCFNPFWDLE